MHVTAHPQPTCPGAALTPTRRQSRLPNPHHPTPQNNHITHHTHTHHTEQPKNPHSMSRDPRRTSTAPKRTSLLPRPSSIAIDPTALIAQHVQLTGTYPITIGPGAVLHPHSRVNSTGCAVMLGEGSVVYERARVGAGEVEDLGGRPGLGRRISGVTAGARGDGVVLGRNVVVETGAVVEAAEVGDGCVVEAGAVVGRGCVLGRVSGHFPPPPFSFPLYLLLSFISGSSHAD